MGEILHRGCDTFYFSGMLSFCCWQEQEGDAAQAVVVHQEDFVAALGQLVPSLSPPELQRYQTLQQQFKPAA